jgi:hypothetical protein
LLHYLRKELQYPLARGLGGPRAGLDVCEKRKIKIFWPGIEPWII